jgi:hypothetical protein
MLEKTHVQNKYLTRENILLEKHIVYLRSVIRRLEILVDIATTSSPTSSPPPTLHHQRRLDPMVWALPLAVPSLGEVPRYRITTTIFTFIFPSSFFSLPLL